MKKIFNKLMNFISNNKGVLLLIIILIALSTPLRFTNLGYSDYHGDEFKSFLSLSPGENIWNFLLSQRKGPVQFLVSYIPYLFTHDFKNQFAQRFPFSLASCLSVIFFFLFVMNITKSKAMAFFASLFYITNGFISGFGRISQYQNLNLLFSFISLWLFSYLAKYPLSDKKSVKHTLLGTVFWCLSVLSHWDAVLIAPIVIYFIVKSFILSGKEKIQGIKKLLLCVVLGMTLVLPFFIPYAVKFKEIQKNQDYASRRIGIDIGYSKIPLYKSLTELYNPFLTIPLLVGAGLIGVLNMKKSIPILIWFIVVFGFFEFFVRNPGTHFYNFLLPLTILAGIGIGTLFNLHKITRYILIIPILGAFAFLYYQTYILFVDHSKEYPFEFKTVLKVPYEKAKGGYLVNLVAPEILEPKPDYMRGSYIPLFGFPHKRFWIEINDFVNSQNSTLNEELKYITNEDKSISDRYMDTKYGLGGSFYAVGIKRPMNFVVDYKISNYASKKLVHTIDLNGETVVFIYKAKDPLAKQLK